MNGKQKPQPSPQDPSKILTPAELKDLAKASNLPVEKVARIASLTVTRSWSGPYPPPEVFAQYPPEVQKIIVANVKVQMEHRHQLENKVVDSNIKNSSKGMNFAFIIMAIFVLGGIVLLALGKTIEGYVTALGPVLFQGINFMLQKHRESVQINKNAKKEGEE